MQDYIIEAGVIGWLDAYTESGKQPGKKEIAGMIKGRILNHRKVRAAMARNPKKKDEAVRWVNKYAKSYESAYDEDVSMATNASLIGFIITMGVAIVAGYILGMYVIPATLSPFLTQILAYGVGVVIALYSNHKINTHILSHLKSKEGIAANKWYQSRKDAGEGGIGDSTAALQKFFNARRR